MSLSMVNHDKITGMSKQPGKAVKLSKIMWTDDDGDPDNQLPTV